jgi:hypothetical protein
VSDELTMDLSGLEKLRKALGGDLPELKVGILGDSARTGGQTNAEIGYRHEVGVGVPRRSFLRDPLEENLENYLESSGAFDNDVLADVIKGGSVTPWLQKVGVVAENVIADAFATGGFGNWPALSPLTVRRKRNNQILVETNQLRDSITSEVKDGK